MTVQVRDAGGDLIALLGSAEKVSTGDSVRRLHAHDGSVALVSPPDVVVYPETTEDVARVMRYAAAHCIAVTAWGAGTSPGGKIVPLEAGIVLNMTRMNGILAIHAEDFDVVVQPGVLREMLNHRLGDHGLFFPVDPGADATLGGMASTNASGTTTVRYGGMHHNVLGLEAVLADGSIVRTGTRARKSSAGYDITNLLIGSEGTLAVITSLTLKVYAIPEQIIVGRVSFGDLGQASEAVVRLVGLSSALSRIELLDGMTIGIVNAHFGSDLAVGPTLFIEWGGAPVTVDDEITFACEVCGELGARDFIVERDPTAQSKLWFARHNFGHAIVARYPGQRGSTDICVPISEFPAAVMYARRLIDESGLEAALVAHAGDGNFHFAFMLGDAPEALTTFRAIYAQMVDDAITRGGTSSGEHGIGIEKQEFLQREHGDLLPLMRRIKNAFDPAGILNPGKILAPMTSKDRPSSGEDSPPRSLGAP